MDTLFSETNISGDSGNLIIDFDVLELDENLAKKLHDYVIELNGQIMQTGITSAESRTSVSIPKLAFTLGPSNIKITVTEIANPLDIYSSTYIVTKEDRDTFVYNRKFQHDKSPQLIDDVYIKTEEGISIKNNNGSGYVALEIPTIGKASISNIKVLNSEYTKIKDIKKVVDMTFKEDLDSGKVYEIKLNTIADKMKSIKIDTK